VSPLVAPTWNASTGAGADVMMPLNFVCAAIRDFKDKA
jgi:hypothetical protein